MKKRESALIEDLEPFVPRHSLERLPAAEAGKINSQNASVLSGSTRALYNGWLAAMRLNPPPDFLVVCRCLSRTGCAIGSAGSGAASSIGATGCGFAFCAGSFRTARGCRKPAARPAGRHAALRTGTGWSCCTLFHTPRSSRTIFAPATGAMAYRLFREEMKEKLRQQSRTKVARLVGNDWNSDLDQSFVRGVRSDGSPV